MSKDKLVDASYFAYDLIDRLYSYDFIMCDNRFYEQGELVDKGNWLVRVLVIVSV